MAKIRVKQIKSPIGRKGVQRKILISLGLNKMNRENILEENSAIIGIDPPSPWIITSFWWVSLTASNAAFITADSLSTCKGFAYGPTEDTWTSNDEGKKFKI